MLGVFEFALCRSMDNGYYYYYCSAVEEVVVISHAATATMDARIRAIPLLKFLVLKFPLLKLNLVSFSF